MVLTTAITPSWTFHVQQSTFQLTRSVTSLRPPVSTWDCYLSAATRPEDLWTNLPKTRARNVCPDEVDQSPAPNEGRRHVPAYFIANLRSPYAEKHLKLNWLRWSTTITPYRIISYVLIRGLTKKYMCIIIITLFPSPFSSETFYLAALPLEACRKYVSQNFL